jgi:hypothetical protein
MPVDGSIGAVHDPRDLLTSVRLELARFPAVLDALLKDLDRATGGGNRGGRRRSPRIFN